MAMIAITTSNSISVKPFRAALMVFDIVPPCLK
jgi:hypothetical protein